MPTQLYSVIYHLIIKYLFSVLIFCFDFFIPCFLKISFLCYTCSIIQLLYRCLDVFNNGTEDLETQNYVKSVFKKCMFL